VDLAGFEPATSALPRRRYQLRYKPMRSGTGESNPVRPRPKRGPVTVPDVPEVPGRAAAFTAPAERSMYAIHCGVLNYQRRSAPKRRAKQG